jgi:hypothetical protein
MPLQFNIETSRRLMLSLLGASTALLFASFGLIGAGVSSGTDAGHVFAAGVSGSLIPLGQCAFVSLIALIMVEIADHPSTPEQGHPHSKNNYLATVGAVGIVWGLGTLLWGGFTLITSAIVHV